MGTIAKIRAIRVNYYDTKLEIKSVEIGIIDGGEKNKIQRKNLINNRLKFLNSEKTCLEIHENAYTIFAS